LRIARGAAPPGVILRRCERGDGSDIRSEGTLMSAGLKTFANQFLRSTAAPYRLVRWEMKRRGILARRDRMIADYLAKPGPKKLHIGCGHNKPGDWLNTDITDHADVCFLDATTTFPMPDNAFDYAFSEHMIEHVPYEAGQVMLKECLRVLKPGGKVRIATPNLTNILALYTDAPTPIQQEYIRWSIDRHTPVARHLHGGAPDQHVHDQLGPHVRLRRTLADAIHDRRGIRQHHPAPPRAERRPKPARHRAAREGDRLGRNERAGDDGARRNEALSC
jgi:predicted SAM-dependent methyltransferase